MILFFFEFYEIILKLIVLCTVAEQTNKIPTKLTNFCKKNLAKKELPFSEIFEMIKTMQVYGRRGEIYSTSEGLCFMNAKYGCLRKGGYYG